MALYPSDAWFREKYGDPPMRTWPTHARMVADLAKDGQLILESLTPRKVDLWHAATGVATEAGELLDAVKKHVIYNKPEDRKNIIEEIGDLEFYLEQVRQNCGISREECLEANMEKLGIRYSQGYNDRSAQIRVDKQQGGISDGDGDGGTGTFG